MVAAEGAPVQRPSAADFDDFLGYVRQLDPLLRKYGVVRVLPPETWRARFPPAAARERADALTIPAPIRQRSRGRSGVFEHIFVEEKSMSGRQFREYAEKRDAEERHAGKSVEDLERTFWSNLNYQSPLYGADVECSLFADAETEWNLSRLPGMLEAMPRLGRDIPGINSPYLYYGSFRSLFAWHREDLDLFSINYVHCGRQKLWYSIPPEQAPRMKAHLERSYPLMVAECKEFDRHKLALVSPTILHAAGIPVYRTVQEEGEFVITYPAAYHAGFNLGYNVAEAVNFATAAWVPAGLDAEYCYCGKQGVRLNVRELCTGYYEANAVEKEDEDVAGMEVDEGEVRRDLLRVVEEMGEEVMGE